MAACAIITFYGVLVFAGAAETPPDFAIKAFSGSRAPWGSNQYLTIDSLGNVSFHESTIETRAADSAFVTLTPAEVQAIYDTVAAVNYFSLDSLYDSGALDGSGIAFWITASGTTHAVEARNIPISEVNRIARTINAILAPDSIALNYGGLNE